jgi:hypothetical protein
LQPGEALSEPSSVSDSPRSVRRHDVDWLRVLVMLVVFTYHCAKIFDLQGWHIKNDLLSMAASAYVRFADAWQMPMFFLLSGVAAWFALDVRTSGQYVMERIKRLVVPFVFGLFVIIPPQSYFEQLHFGAFSGPYLEFYPHFFRAIAFELSIRWFGVGHNLWFLGYLFVFSMLALPLFLFLKTESGRRFTSKLAGFFVLPGAILLLAVPFSISEGMLQWLPSEPKGWALFFLYAPSLLYGYLIFADARFEQAVLRHTWVALGLGALTMIAVIGIHLYGSLEPVRNNFWLHLGWRFLKGFNMWFWMVAILGLGMKYLRASHKLQPYANQLVLPFYILHQSVIIVIGFYVVQWNTSVLVKFLVVFAASLVTILALYDLLIRRIGALRFVFGMRPKRRASSPVGVKKAASV